MSRPPPSASATVSSACRTKTAAPPRTTSRLNAPPLDPARATPDLVAPTTAAAQVPVAGEGPPEGRRGRACPQQSERRGGPPPPAAAFLAGRAGSRQPARVAARRRSPRLRCGGTRVWELARRPRGGVSERASRSSFLRHPSTFFGRLNAQILSRILAVLS